MAIYKQLQTKAKKYGLGATLFFSGIFVALVANGLVISGSQQAYAAQSMTSITSLAMTDLNTGSGGIPGGASGGGSGTCGVGKGTSVFQCPAGGTNDNITKMILEVSKFIFGGVGVLCVIGISMGGIIYVTAGGDTSKTKQGIGYIINAVIGLVIFIFLFVLLNFLVPGGFFNNAGLDPTGNQTPADTGAPACSPGVPCAQ